MVVIHHQNTSDWVSGEPKERIVANSEYSRGIVRIVRIVSNSVNTGKQS